MDIIKNESFDSTDQNQKPSTSALQQQQQQQEQKPLIQMDVKPMLTAFQQQQHLQQQQQQQLHAGPIQRSQSQIEREEKPERTEM